MTLFRDKLTRHSRTLTLLRPREKLAYVLEKIKEKLDEKLERIERTIKKIVCRLFLDIGRRVPPPLRTFYFLEAGDQAVLKYEPHVYSGRVLLFHSKNRSPDVRFWDELTTRGLEIYEVPGGHLDIMREPHVWTLAEKLRACLAQAQEVKSEKGSMSKLFYCLICCFSQIAACS